MTAPTLQISDLRVAFPELARRVQAVRGVSLEIAPGEIFGLVGESGSGKSVTALSCLGLVPPPGQVSGSITVTGRQVVGRSDAELADLRGGAAAMIFQNPAAAMNPFLSVGRQISDAIRAHRSLDAKAAAEVAEAAIAAVQIPDPDLALRKYPHQMSGGQLQRVMIAMAMACEPRLLIADEPTTALDVTIQAQIIALLRRLAEETGLAILFITHDLGVVASLCDRVAVMYGGLIVETGGVDGVFAAPAHPYTLKLMETVPTIGQRSRELVYIPGQVPDMAFPPSGCTFHERCEKASDVCRRQQPVMRALPEGRRVACHHAPGSLSLDVVEGREAAS
jgi:oligopeptide/dipeptide ABC transporter ATP-binding protein